MLISHSNVIILFYLAGRIDLNRDYFNTHLFVFIFVSLLHDVVRLEMASFSYHCLDLCWGPNVQPSN